MVLDLLLVILWIGCIIFGVGSGLIRQFFLLGAACGGLLLAPRLYKPLAEGLSPITTADASLLEPVAYGTIFLLSVILLGLGSYLIYPATHLRSQPALDDIGGAVVGAVWATVLVAGMVLTLDMLVQVPVTSSLAEAHRGLQLSLMDSRLYPVLLERAPVLHGLTEELTVSLGSL